MAYCAALRGGALKTFTKWLIIRPRNAAWPIAAVVAVCVEANLLTAYAQPVSGTISYPASYFAGAQVNTAFDLVSRLPGFEFDDGKVARGYAGTAGNVLIDGERPSAKTDDLRSFLKRIPADRVDHIDVVRGGAPGIDMYGQSVVANVILKSADRTTTIVTLSNLLYRDGTDAPGGAVELSQKTGDVTYDISLTRYNDVSDDSAGNGDYVFLTPSDGAENGSVRRRGGLNLGWGINSSTSFPLGDGKFSANFTAQRLNFNETLAYGPPNDTFFATGAKTAPNELGLKWNATIRDNEITLMALQRLERDQNSDTQLIAGASQVFGGVQNTGETILRGTWLYHSSETLTLEGGGEGVYNTFDARSTFFDNGTAVSIPGSDARVNERRGEVFGEATWKFSNGSVEAGSRIEFSRISAVGVPSRSLSYVKPRVLVSWSPWTDTQLRVRAERIVGQLNFSNFVASSNLSGAGVAAGNLHLRPDQHLQFEGDYEFHFWGTGALVASVMHDDITDLVDYIPISNGLDGVGNIPKARNLEFKLNLSIPLDRVGVTGGILKANLQWDDSALRDPLTGQERPISGQQDRNLSFEFTQDVEMWNSTFDVQFSPGAWSKPFFRLQQVSTTRLTTPYLQASWEYKPTPDVDLVVEMDELIPYNLEVQQENYAGPRNTVPLGEIRLIRSTAEPRLWLQLRKTF